MQMLLMQRIDDEQLEGSGFVFQSITEVLAEFCQPHSVQASSCVELPKKF